jgi:hypothetical protein
VIDNWKTELVEVRVSELRGVEAPVSELVQVEGVLGSELVEEGGSEASGGSDPTTSGLPPTAWAIVGSNLFVA